jgi:hypothetical protein
MRGNLFSKCNSFFLKFQDKNKFKKLGNMRNLFQKDKQIDVKPRLHIVMTETRTRSRKSLRSVTHDREEDNCLFLQENFLNKYTTNNSTARHMHVGYVRSGCMYTREDPLRVVCTSATPQKMKNK